MTLDPKKIHQLDQETGPMHELAGKLAAYHRSLRSHGFTKADALAIVLGYQSAVVISTLSKDNSDGR